jgi:hypothetical protein
VDALEVRTHDFHARNLAGMDGMRQRQRIEISDGIMGHGFLAPTVHFACRTASFFIAGVYSWNRSRGQQNTSPLKCFRAQQMVSLNA